MIKSIFDESEEQIKREITGEEISPVAPETQSAQTNLPPPEAENLAEAKPEEIFLSEARTENVNLPATNAILEIPELREQESFAEPEPVIVAETETRSEIPIFDSAEARTESHEQTLPAQTDFKPETPAETIRKSGLAYAAGIVLFGSIVFMLLIGWFFDLLVGTSPWGIVGGIVLGAILGFYQFFRLTSQIINNKN